MFTRTQKNDRKQMREVKTELNNENAPEYFGYMENEHITRRYTPKKQRKITRTPYTIVLLFTIGVYALLNFMQNDAGIGKFLGLGTNSTAEAESPAGNSSVNAMVKNQSRIAEDLQFIDTMNISLRSKMERLNVQVKDMGLSANSQDIDKSIQECLQVVHENIDGLEKYPFQNITVDYTNAVNEYYQAHIRLLTCLQTYRIKQDSESAASYNAEVEICNQAGLQAMDELENTLIKAGIQFTKTENGYQYTYPE